MIKHVWTVLCERVLEDTRTKNTTLAQVVERLTVNVPPQVETPFGIRHKLTLASLWYNMDPDQERSGQVFLSVSYPDGSELEHAEHAFSLHPHAFFKLYMNIDAITLVGEGIYEFIVRFKEQGKKRRLRVASIPMNVEFNIDASASLIKGRSTVG